MDAISPIPLSAIEAARARIGGAAVRTPLLRLDRRGAGEVWLKLESLQPIGSFKIRGAANAMALAPDADLARGVYTASAGNMAQGVAFAARRLGLTCRVIVPDSAPRTKLRAVERLGGVVVAIPFADWWNVIQKHGHPDESGFFIHPVSDPAVIAGNGTVGLEIIEDLEFFDSVVVPYGGGGLSCGVASAMKAKRPGVPVYAAEVDTAAPFAASLAANRASSVERIPTFVDGIGGSSVLEEMWPLARDLLRGSLVVSIESVCDAIRTLADHAHIISEGAGGAAVAAAMRRADETDEVVVAIVSGGNIDLDTLTVILDGRQP
ncbi:MAG: pyridoxal-phosphate dependent enzyme [Gemmatimonadota bacterium]|nr:pyridoxal-phosphate dependent enzyme [Gemmatimonadota bacterium]